ncbi:MAG: tetratricopeptide repeat protein [Deltaproteobacteria bacterium]|nr:tetratricopeptide repeat protein [Deltaproteobacteria bacterium]
MRQRRKNPCNTVNNAASIASLLLLVLLTSSCSIHNPPGGASSYEALCGIPEPCLKSALLDKKRGEPQEARTKLLEMRRRFPDTVWSWRASFLLGVWAVEAGDEGAASYLDDAGRLMDIKDYSLFYRARALRAQKKPVEAASAYESLASSYPASTLLHEALYEKALSLEEAGDIPLAKKALGDYMAAAGEGRDAARGVDAGAARALLKTAEYAVRMNEGAEAIKALRTLLTRFPSGPLAKDAEEMKRDLASRGAGFPDWTAEELWTRGRAFFDAADYKNSASEFSALLKRTGPGTGHYGEASILLALSQIRLKRYQNAEKTLRDYLDGNAENELDALYWLSFALLRQESFDSLMETESILALFRPPQAGELRFPYGDGKDAFRKVPSKPPEGRGDALYCASLREPGRVKART